MGLCGSLTPATPSGTLFLPGLCLQVKGCSWTAASLRSKPNDPDSGELEGEGLLGKGTHERSHSLVC